MPSWISPIRSLINWKGVVIAQTAPVLSNPKEDSGKARHRRYNATDKGKARGKKYRQSLKGRDNKMMCNLRYRLKLKLQRVAELEEEIHRYEQKDSNRAGAC